MSWQNQIHKHQYEIRFVFTGCHHKGLRMLEGNNSKMKHMHTPSHWRTDGVLNISRRLGTRRRVTSATVLCVAVLCVHAGSWFSDTTYCGRCDRRHHQHGRWLCQLLLLDKLWWLAVLILVLHMLWKWARMTERLEAMFTAERFLSAVQTAVLCQVMFVLESFVTDRTHKWPLTCTTNMFLQLDRSQQQKTYTTTN